MKNKPFIFLSLLALTLAPAGAAGLYVNIATTNPTPPYTTWASAATNIQDAVDTASAGDEIVVTNGVYATGGRAVVGTMTNRVAVTKAVTVRSVNGPEVTVIRGYQVPGTTNGDGAVRCVYLVEAALLSGFTLTHGATRDDPSGVNADYEREQSGGGVWCNSTSAMVSNCVLSGNSASWGGGGVYQGTLNNCTLAGNSAVPGGGAFESTLNNCTLTGNSAYTGGGASDSTLNDCTLRANSADSGGGVYYGTLNRCTLTGNSAGSFGGGGAAYSKLDNCVVTGNSARNGGGAFAGTLNNCVLAGNSAAFGGGAIGYDGFGGSPVYLNHCILTGNFAANDGGGVAGGTLNNCTLAGNSAGNAGGGAAESVAHLPEPHVVRPILHNCIVYFNQAPIEANCASCNCEYSCTTPLPNGIGNFVSPPLFVDSTSGNFGLQPNSPCINAGLNASAPGGTDLDGNPRIVGGTVDVGAYEFQSPQSLISYAWLQQYDLPTDGSADNLDPDADHSSNFQEWRAGTDPTNALSALRLLAPEPSGPDLVLRWSSVAGGNYILERSTNLTSGGSFIPIARNIPGQVDSTPYLDSNVGTNGGRYFYRVGIE